MQSSPSDPMEVDGEPRRSTKVDQDLLGVSDITFEENEEGLHITWSAINDAVRYDLSGERWSMGDVEELSKHYNDNHCTFENAIYDWKNGDTVCISIEATLMSKIKVPVVSRSPYVIGGGVVPSKVYLRVNEEHSYKSLILSWIAPTKDPSQYEIAVFFSKTKEVERSVVANSSKTEEVIDNLDFLSEYYCSVTAKYGGSDGKVVFSNPCKTEDLPADLFGVQQIMAYPDSRNPARLIAVKWNEPDTKLKILHYEVYLEQKNGKKTPRHEVKVDRNKMVCFKDLKSDTQYRACVTTVRKNLIGVLSSKTKTSDYTKTDPAVKDPEFDLYKQGKPTIEVCSAEPSAKGYIGRFKWRYPDLGSEKHNYKVLSTEEQLQSSGGKSIPLDDRNGERFAELQSGKTYFFTAECHFWEIDTEKEHTVIDQKKVVTEMKSPKILCITWKDRSIIITWEKAEGAASTVMKVFNEKNVLVHTTVNLVSYNGTLELPMEYSYQYGNTCRFVFEAKDKNGIIKETTKTALIGGPKVARNLKIKSKGSRWIKASWDPPQNKPMQYQVQIYEMVSGKATNVGGQKEMQVECSHKFMKLKTETSYFCEVCPVYGSEPSYASVTDIAVTDKKEEDPIEKDMDFGKTESISTQIHDQPQQNMAVKISWTNVNPGINFQVIAYNVQMKSTSSAYNVLKWRQKESRLDTKEPLSTSVIARDVLPGEEYKITVTTVLKDLDTYRSKECEKHKLFKTDPKAAVLLDKCDWTKGVVRFSWMPVPGADSYDLILRDEMMKGDLVPTKNIAANSQNVEICSASFQMSERLRTGQTCTAKLVTHANNEMKCQSDWKTFLIGSEKHPRNVNVIHYNQDPIRSVIITFDQPRHGIPERYKIVAVPEQGRRKTCYSKSSPFIFKYLKSNTHYTFEVTAEWNNIFGDASKSNKIQTMQKGGSGNPGLNFSHFRNATLYQSGFQIHNDAASSNDIKADGFGIARGIKTDIEPNGEEDKCNIRWSAPSFGHHSADYKVEFYTVYVQRGMEKALEYKVYFEEGVIDYSKDVFLNLGGEYEVSVETQYEDIDSDNFHRCASDRRTVFTRPCKPTITHNLVASDKLKLSWNAVTGAESYMIAIFIDRKSLASLKDRAEQNCYERNFDHILGYGKSYHAEITAVGKGGTKNQSSTKEIVIGGDYVPTNVSAANSEVSDPSTQVLLKWTEPKSSPKSYEIEAQSENNPVIRRSVDKIDSYLFENLKGGTVYVFKVMAIHADVQPCRTTVGSPSNEVTTSPQPMQVKNVRVKLGTDPTTSIEVDWDEIESKDGELKYQVHLKSKDYKIKRMNILTNHTCVSGLQPGTNFAVAVSACNLSGFGKESDDNHVTTKLETPKGVTLQNNSERPTTSLYLNFQPTKSKATAYVCKLYKHQYQCTLPAGESFQIHECPHKIPNLEANQEYQIEVSALFEATESDRILSNKLKTGPDKTEIEKCECYMNEKNGSRQIFVRWKSYPGINYHEVKFMKQLSGEVENILSVERENEIIYSCRYESIDYSVQVRPRNNSTIPLFGDWSDQKYVSLAPAKLDGIKAETREDGNIEITCSPALGHSPLYFMDVVCNGNLLPVEPIKSDDVGHDIVKWIYTPNQYAQEYQFRLWAQYRSTIKGQITTSNKVTSKPAVGEITDLTLSQDRRSTDIVVSWKELENCRYQIKICDSEGNEEIKFISAELTHNYRCQIAGSQYKVCVRGVRNSVYGTWSDEKSIMLAPDKVSLQVDASNEPVECIDLSWNQLRPSPDVYHVKLCCDHKEILEQRCPSSSESMHFKAPQVEPGRFYHCEVAGFNEAGYGEYTSSKMYHIVWNNPKDLEVKLHEDDPCHKAVIKWDKPVGVNRFELEIQNVHETRGIHTKHTGTEYLFESGIPGNTYLIRLYWGCNEVISHEFIRRTVTMKPVAPKNVKATGLNAAVLVEFEDIPSSRKKYEISVKCPTDNGEENTLISADSRCYVDNLTPGRSYRVSVATVIENEKSFPGFCGYIVHTLPGKIQNLTSNMVDDHVVFTWNVLEIPSSKYVIQWRIENESVTEDETTANSYSINFVKPARAYRLRVAARNDAGVGEMTDWTTFISKPDPPKSVTVSKNRKITTPHLVVKVNEEFHNLKKYRVRVKSGNRSDPPVPPKETSKLPVLFNDLKPGTPYDVYAKTIFCGKESEETKGFPDF